MNHLEIRILILIFFKYLYLNLYMAKGIFQANIVTKGKKKRVRGTKSKKELKKNKKSKTDIKSKIKSENTPDKPFDMNYYYLKERIKFLKTIDDMTINKLLELEKEEFLEINSNTKENEPNYSEENRALVLVGLKDIISQLCEQNEGLKFPDSFIFEAIALFDYYLDRAEKKFKRSDMVKALYACLDLIDKKLNVGVFCSSFFKNFYDTDLQIEIIETVDLNFKPVKIYDFFQIFYFKITQKKTNCKFLEYMDIFKNVFLDISFYILFHEHSKKEKPSTNFVSCMLLTYQNTKIFLPENENFQEMNEFLRLIEYYPSDFLNSKIMLEESIDVYNKLMKNLK